MENTQPAKNTQINEGTQTTENKHYLKYKDRFSRMSIFFLFSNVLILCAILSFVFVKNFEIKFGSLVLARYSLFDEFKYAINKFFSGNLGEQNNFNVFHIAISGMLLFFLPYCFLGALICLIKGLYNISNSDKYARKQYEKLKRCAVRYKKNNIGPDTESFCITFIILILMGIIPLILSKCIYSLDKDNEDLKGLGFFASLDEFTYNDGVSYYICFFVLFVIAFLVMYIIARVIFSDIKKEILKEEYSAEEQK